MTDRTDQDLLVDNVTHTATAMAARLRNMADRVEQQAAGFRTPQGLVRSNPLGRAADILNDITQEFGSMGSQFWTLVKGAEDLANNIHRDAEERKTARQVRFIAQVGTRYAAMLAQPASLGTTEAKFTDIGEGRVRFDARTLAHLLTLKDHDECVVSRDPQGVMWMFIGGTEYQVQAED